MGEPIIIWPPDGGSFADYGDTNSNSCTADLSYGWNDCSAEYEAGGGMLGDGLACCLLGE